MRIERDGQMLQQYLAMRKLTRVVLNTALADDVASPYLCVPSVGNVTNRSPALAPRFRRHRL